MLINILAILEHLKVFNCAEGRNPCLLLDGQSNRFALDFLKYVINPLYEWVVCIGVPYGTTL